MRARLRQFVFRHATRILTAPLCGYMRSSGQDVEHLKRHVRKGDVLLVCGDQRVSEVIRYLTQSSWSHAAIYVGDDETDEDVFALDQPGRLLSIRVGPSAASRADYYIESQAEIDQLLSLLIRLRDGTRAITRRAMVSL